MGTRDLANFKRPVRIDGDIAYVSLTKGYVATIDSADVNAVAGWNWCAFVRGETVYAVRSASRKTIYMHRALISPPDGCVVDHVDGNGLDNRRANLRVGSQMQNTWNSRTKRSNTSGVKGVCFDRSRAKWIAHIRCGGKRINLGRFDNIRDAEAAYRAASMRIHGQFSRLD